MVYVLMVTYPYEFSKVIGVYSDKGNAETQRDISVAEDESKGYNQFDIEEFDLA